MLSSLVVSALALAYTVQPVKSDYAWTETIYIRADGSIQPPTAPISSVDNVTYTLTENIAGNVPADSSAIIIQRDNIIIDGAGYTLQGTKGSDSKGIELTGISNVTIKNMKITAFYYGIWLDSSSNNSVSGNNITNNHAGIYLHISSGNSVSGNTVANNSYGIWLGDSSNNSVSGNNITSNWCCIQLYYSSNNNSVSGNNITASNWCCIQLYYSSNNNSVSGNNIANNLWGIALYYSSNNNTIYHNNFINNTGQVSSYDSTNVWDDGYPSGGNYWSDYTGLDQKCGPSQDHPGSDGIGDTPYVIDSNNKDNCPLMNPWTPPAGHNIAVVSAVSSKIVIFQGFSGNITVYGANKGEYSETFNVTVYANTTEIASMVSPLENDSTTNITLSWNTNGFAKGNYTISAYAWPVPGETNTANNNYTDGWVIVSIAGDLTGGTSNPWDFMPDGKVDGKDITIVALCFGSAPGCSPPYIWNPNSDVNNDAKIDGKDIAIVALHFGQADP
jgi:parallel beta-helix repeat protein